MILDPRNRLAETSWGGHLYGDLHRMHATDASKGGPRCHSVRAGLPATHDRESQADIRSVVTVVLPAMIRNGDESQFARC